MSVELHFASPYVVSCRTQKQHCATAPLVYTDRKSASSALQQLLASLSRGLPEVNYESFILVRSFVSMLRASTADRF